MRRPCLSVDEILRAFPLAVGHSPSMTSTYWSNGDRRVCDQRFA